jgi:aspartyl-tRNA(Asn)/glutamyl-tRNA(Gln) amidotransferase subunit C
MTDAASSLTLQEARHVAKLARLRVDDAALEVFRSQLASILGYMEKLNELDVSGVEPVAHPTALTNRLDDDVPTAAMPLADLLRNAPATEDRYLAVPKVLGDGGGA